MLDANELRYISINELDTPQEIFNMCMEYAKKTNKNPWKCFGEVFNPNYYTVVLMDDNNYVGYGNCNSTADITELFFNHGYLRKAMINKNIIVNKIAQCVEKRIGIKIKRVTIASDLNPKLWHMWGFKEDKQIAYVKEV
jgi:hypothetical protein